MSARRSPPDAGAGPSAKGRKRARTLGKGPAEARPEGKAREAAPLSPALRRAFTVGMLLLPLLFFGLLEGGLRLGGYGGSYPLFGPAEGVPGWRVQNTEVARRYFASTRAVPNANADYFAAEKPAGSFRLVAQGGSSAAGFPYYWGAAFPRVLGARLRAAYPERPVETVNTAMAAVNSYTLLDFVDEIIAERPDAVVVYAGHNEYYGALGAASSENIGRNPRLVRAYLSLKRWRTVQLVRNGVARLRAAGTPQGERPSQTLMEQMVGEQRVPYGSPLFEAGLAQFTQNLDALLARYARAGIPVYIGTLASNERDQRPFISAHAAGADTAAWGQAIRTGYAALVRSQPDAALAAFERAVALDGGAADGHFGRGRALLALGQSAPAARAFVRAKDLDALRFRAPEVFNDLIRELAARHGARVVETAEALRAASPGGAIGRELMLEHLHPTLEGYRLIADAFFERMAADGVVGPAGRTAPPSRLVALATPVDSLVGAIRLDALTRAWPFRPDEAQPVRVDTPRVPLRAYELARDLYANRTDWPRATDAWALFAADRQDWTSALTARRALVQMYPFEPGTHLALGNLRMEMAQSLGRPDFVEQAYASYEGALAREPGSAAALAMLGAIRLQRYEQSRQGLAPDADELNAAVGFLERALRSAPAEPQVLYNLAGAYALAGRTEDALRTVDALLARVPNHGPAQALRASVARAQG